MAVAQSNKNRTGRFVLSRRTLPRFHVPVKQAPLLYKIISSLLAAVRRIPFVVKVRQFNAGAGSMTRMFKRTNVVLPQQARHRLKQMASVPVLLAVVGCATTNHVKQIDHLDSAGDSPSILVVSPDVKYYLLTAGGVTEPHAEWTEAADRNFSNSLRAYANERDIRIVELGKDRPLGGAEISYRKLYSAVGTSILTHHFGHMKLPTKQGGFDWSLGPGIAEIAGKYDADYALFSYYRDYQASGGRVALALVAAVAGIAVSTGGEGGFASLVDLQTGDVVWFNQVEAGAGELRDKERARATVDTLFDNFPAS